MVVNEIKPNLGDNNKYNISNNTRYIIKIDMNLWNSVAIPMLSVEVVGAKQKRQFFTFKTTEILTTQ